MGIKCGDCYIAEKIGGVNNRVGCPYDGKQHDLESDCVNEKMYERGQYSKAANFDYARLH